MHALPTDLLEVLARLGTSSLTSERVSPSALVTAEHVEAGPLAMPLALSLAGADLLVLVLVALAALGVGALVGWFAAARRASGVLVRAREEGQRLVEAATSRAEAEGRRLVEAAEEEVSRRQEAWEQERARQQQELREGEEEVAAQHRRLVDRDRAMQRRDQLLGRREESLEGRVKEVEDRLRGVVELEEKVLVRLEEAAELSRDEAKRQLMEELRAEARQAAAADVRAIKEELQRNVETEAQKIMALAIERLASDFSAERAVNHVTLPQGNGNGNLRGRIIGVEGRNIRAFEQLTGMQLVLDDDPTHVVISGFNPVRREIARRALEKLVDGGTIHPRKIQHVVAATKKKVDAEILRTGREAAKEFGFEDMHDEVAEALGRLRYRTSYGQNVLEHVKEAARICGMMAVELRLDQKLAERAALLHDIGKALDFEQEGTHPEIGGELARRCGEHDVVINAIESHHEDCEVIHPISVLVAAADALSGARPGARRRTTVDYIRRINKLEELASSFKGVESCYALQAGREVRVIVGSRRVDDDGAALLAHDLSQRIQSEMEYPGRIKITVIREHRAEAVAR